MAVKKLEKEEWENYFNNFSRKFIKDKKTEYAEIRVLSIESGDQPETQWIPLLGISYDDKDDLLEIAVDKLDHLIYHPDEIFVDENGDIITSLQITKKDGEKQIIELR